ncbi:NUDIX domain-containing protein [candidate division WWE3 bacterium]|nr:NUDIX domain-containing protein [candidate division WWE3 bacterium]
MTTKTSFKILEYIHKNKRVETKDLIKTLKIGKRAIYKQLNILIKNHKISKYGIPPHVFYTLYAKDLVPNLLQTIKQKPYKVTRDMQIKELINRVPPVVNVNLVIYKEGKFLIGTRSIKKDKLEHGLLLYPGGRMQFDETIAQCTKRILEAEVCGVQANLRRLITACTDLGTDVRSYNVNLYYLMDYVAGTPKPSFQFDSFKWYTEEELTRESKIVDEVQDIIGEVSAAVRLINTNEEEILVEADRDDNEVGSISKREAHHTSSRFHRAAHIVIFTSKGEVVLHQRSMNKITSAGKWDMFGGHQVYGHTIGQTAQAELAEELGINVPLTLVEKNLYSTNTQNEWAYLYYGISDGPYGFDRNEVAQIKVFDCERLLNGEYSKGYDILSHVFTYIERLRFIWGKLKVS